MIVFIGTRRQTHLLRTMRRDARMPEWHCHTYQWLFRTRRLPAATYIFLGVDRLDHAERRLAGQYYRHINGLGDGWRALNDPAIAMGRYRLLRSLHTAGVNDFNAYLAAEGVTPARFPVFIRRNSSSTPPLTGLVTAPKELQAEIDRLIAAGEPPEDLVIIEYAGEPLRPGLFQKQSEYRIADAYIPTPTIYAGDWVVKVSNTIPVPDDVAERDLKVMENNPFAAVARTAFEIAGIEYGRADIGIVGGRPQIYEINFNPDVRTQREQPNASPILARLWDQSDSLFFKALSEINSSARGTAPTLSNFDLTAFRLRFWRNYAPQRY